jgi:hypothetical protein
MLAEPAHHKQRNEDESLVELAPEEQLLEAFFEANGTLTSVTVLGVQGDLERIGILREPTERSKEEVCLFLDPDLYLGARTMWYRGDYICLLRIMLKACVLRTRSLCWLAMGSVGCSGGGRVC